MSHINIPIVRVKNRKIELEVVSGTLYGSIMDQLEALLEPFGYVKINQNELVHPEARVGFSEGYLVFGNEPRLKCLVSRRNIQKVKSNFDKNVE